jgi:D-amino acid aminotransferase
MKASGYVFLNGRLVAAGRAGVSVYDRGLLYGDGLFETMRAYRGSVFAIEEHFHRLRTSADILGLPVAARDWPATIGLLLARNRLARRDASVRLTITRGPAAPGVLLPPDAVRSTTIIMAQPLDASIARRQRAGIKAALLPFAPRGFLREHKSLDYLPAVVGRVLASYQGADEGLFVRPDQVVTEGTTSSLFIVRDGVLCTPPARDILPGITRAKVLELAHAHRLPFAERELTTADLRLAQEAFATSSIAEIVPIVALDNAPVGSGRPGPLTRRLQDLYRDAVAQYLRARRRPRSATRR